MTNIAQVEFVCYFRLFLINSSIRKETGCVERGNEERRRDIVVGQSNIRSTTTTSTSTTTTTSSSSTNTLYNCVDLIKKNHPQLVVDCDDLKAIQRYILKINQTIGSKYNRDRAIEAFLFRSSHR